MNRLFKNTIFSSIDIAVLLLLSLLATPILIRHFGLSVYGVFVFLNIFSIYGALSFFDFGMEGALMTHIARFEADGRFDKIHGALKIGIIYYGTIGLIIAAAICAAANFMANRFNLTLEIRGHVFSAIYLVALNIVLQFFSMPFMAVLQGLQKFVLIKSVNSVLNLMQSLSLIAIAAFTKRIDLAFLIIALLTFFRLFAYTAAYFRYLPNGAKGNFDGDIFRTLWKSSSVLFLNRLIGLFYNQTGKILIWWQLPISSMAVYDVINRPGALIRVLSSMVYSAVIPEVSRLKYVDDFNAIRHLYLKMVRYAYMLVLPAIVAMSLHASFLLELWVGPEFSKYDYFIWILMGCAILNPLPAVASTMIVGLDMVKQTVLISIVGTVLHVILGFWLIQIWGIKGLLISILVAETAMAIPYFIAMNHILGMKFFEIFRPLSRTLLLASVAAALHYILSAWTDLSAFWLIGVGVLTLVHYLVEVALLLETKEQNFLFKKLRIRRPTPVAI